MFVIFEGLDKSGKGTLEWEFLKAINFKHIVIDRGPAGYLVFDDLFKRRTDYGDEQYIKNVAAMRSCNNFIVVYCKVSANVAKQRLKEHNETCPYNYKHAQILYDLAIKNLYKDCGIKVIEIDTTKSIEECVNLIIGGLK